MAGWNKRRLPEVLDGRAGNLWFGLVFDCDKGLLSINAIIAIEIKEFWVSLVQAADVLGAPKQLKAESSNHISYLKKKEAFGTIF